MKKLLLLLLCIGSLQVQAQWTLNNVINFDSGDLLYPVAIHIDTQHYHHNQWQIGHPAKSVFYGPYSDLNAILTDTAYPYRPNDTSVFILKIPGNYGATFEDLSFYYKLNIDTTSYGKLEISGNGGTTWLNLLDTLPYHLRWYTTPDFHHSTTGWASATLNKSSLALMPDTLLFRFTFIAGNDTMGKDGWMIDEININYWYTSGIMPPPYAGLCSVYPNPSQGNIYVHTDFAVPALARLKVFNLEGREVYQTNSLPADGHICLPLPDGTYYLRVSSADREYSRKIFIAR